MIKVAILTISDRASRGEREDRSASVVRETIERLDVGVVEYRVVPDEAEQIEGALRSLAEVSDLVLTTGGTGVTPRDITPDVTGKLLEKELPGFAEVMRVEGFKKTPYAIISRAKVGIYNQTLIINLPGSPSGVRECLEVVLPAIEHTIAKIRGEETECGSE